MEAEAEAEAVDGRLKEAEAEAKEKLTAVASLLPATNPPPSVFLFILHTTT